MESFQYFRHIVAITDTDDGTLQLITNFTNAFGFFEYFYCVYLTHKDGKGPFPLWMHLFYLAHDTVWCYVMAREAPNYNYHHYFTSKVIGLGVWSALEVYCIYRVVTVEREGHFSRTRSLSHRRHAFMQNVLLLLVFYAVVLTLFYMIGPESWLHWTLFTRMIMAVGPGSLWLERGTRTGTRVGLATLILFGTINSFTPYSMWVRELPSVFDNYIYYLSGIACTLFALNNVYIVSTLPVETESPKKE